MTEEIFKDIKGYEGLYQVSNLGRVRSLAKKAGFHNRKDKIIKNHITRYGYNLNHLCKNGIVYYISTHRLVAEAFIPNPENKPQINHIDGNRTNNSVDNLEWVTCSENIRHKFDVLGYKGSMFGKKLSENHKKKIGEARSKKVLCVELNKVFNSAREAATWLNLSRNSINESIFRNHKCGGYSWRYVK